MKEINYFIFDKRFDNKYKSYNSYYTDPIGLFEYTPKFPIGKFVKWKKLERLVHLYSRLKLAEYLFHCKYIVRENNRFKLMANESDIYILKQEFILSVVVKYNVDIYPCTIDKKMFNKHVIDYMIKNKIKFKISDVPLKLKLYTHYIEFS